MKQNKYFIKIEWVLSIFLILFFVMELINNRFWLNDFKVYYLAVQNFNKGLPIYGLPFGLDSGYYKYTPFALIPFTPFGFLPYIIASSIYYFIIAAAVILVLRHSIQTIKFAFPIVDIKSQAILYLTTLVILTHIYRELHMGNVNLLLTLIYVFSLRSLLYDKQITAGIFIGLGMLFKPHFIALLPFLIIYRKYKCTGFTLLTLVVGLLLPAIFVGFKANNELLNSWVGMMKMHNINLSASPDTIYAWINKLLSIFSLQYQGTLYVLILVAIISIKYLVFILLNINKEKDIEPTKLRSFNRQHFTITYLMIIAFIPNLTVTDSQHYLFCLPLIILLFGYLLNNNKISITVKTITIIGLIFYGGNWHDLLGHNLSVYLTNNGFLGAGNMIIVAICGWIFLIDNDIIKTIIASFKKKPIANKTP